MPADDPTGRRFGEAVDAYERGRPEYPEAVVAWLLDRRPSRVLDLGAGTGKLTRALVGRVGSVIAVEPDPVMRRALSRRLPATVVLAGSGERIRLPDACVDAVLAGQAWHWVDPERAVPEVARVLRAAGRLGLVWNDRDEEDPWVAELSGLLARFGTSPDAGYRPRAGPPFGPFETVEVAWTHDVTVDAAVDMIASRSYVIALAPDRRSELVGLVRALAIEGADATTGLVPVRYVTRGYRAGLGEGGAGR